MIISKKGYLVIKMIDKISFENYKLFKDFNSSFKKIILLNLHKILKKWRKF